jgi:hypothetical protein
MTTLEEVAAIREIEVLKAGYCRTIDRKDWVGLGARFTVDAQLHHGDNTIRGREAIVEVIRSSIGDVRTSHCAHTPVIAVTGATTATGNWGALYTRQDDATGYGEYDDDYVRAEDGTWLIAETRLTTSFEQRGAATR